MWPGCLWLQNLPSTTGNAEVWLARSLGRGREEAREVRNSRRAVSKRDGTGDPEAEQHRLLLRFWRDLSHIALWRNLTAVSLGP